MSSLITTDIIRYQYPGDERSYRSHILHPHGDITIMCIISASKEHITSVLEDHLLEVISSSEWRKGEEDNDFSYVTENYNNFLNRLADADSESAAILFAVERGGMLMVSSIGEANVILLEDDKMSNIHEDTKGHHRFELISSGEIPIDSSIFISSRDLEGVLGDIFFLDTGKLDSTSFRSTTESVLRRESTSSIHLMRIKRTASREIASERHNSTSKISTLGAKFSGTLSGIIKNMTIGEKFGFIQRFFYGDKKILHIIFLGVGVVIFFSLISYLIHALFDATNNSTQDSKNKIIEARTLIENSQKLISNTSAFDNSIRNAENILTELESQGLYAKDIQEQRNKIEALKKEIYDIQTFSIEGRKSMITFPENITPIGISEKDKKINIIGERSAIYDFGIGDTNINLKKYPDGESAKDFAILEDGNFYILTESNKIIASRKNSDISYLSISGQDTWEEADGIKTFNNNLYLYHTKDGEIYRHKPGLNGFAAKDKILPNPSPGIIDIGIDGGFYILKNDQKIIRFLANTNSQSGIIINKIPGEYTVGKNPESTDLFVRSDLNYIYIRDGDRIWIFSPDSKRFQDVRSWTYVAQIEIQSKETIEDVYIVRDGLIYILTEKGVYDMAYEFVDNHVILRP